MTFWQFLTNVFDWLEARATRILGVIGGTLSVLLASDVIPMGDAKYCMAAIAVLTYWRGQSNSTTVAAAKSIVNQGVVK
jgi:hypothetical protein